MALVALVVVVLARVALRANDQGDLRGDLKALVAPQANGLRSLAGLALAALRENVPHGLRGTLLAGNAPRFPAGPRRGTEQT